MNNQTKNIALSIADFVIRLWTKDSFTLSFDTGYTDFFVDSATPNPVLDVEIIGEIPQSLMTENEAVFRVEDAGKSLWTVCKSDDYYKVIAYNPYDLSTIQQIALVSQTTREWKIYCKPNTAGELEPLLYPMGPLVLYYLTTQQNAIMIHSSGIVDGKIGRLFTGFSGIGKSTMAGLWAKNGSQLINDDRLMLTITNGHITMHNTPMFYRDVPKSNALHAIYLLKQTKENVLTELHGVQALSRVMAFCIQHGYDKQFIAHHLAVVSEICNALPICELGFKPDDEIIAYLRAYDK